MVARVAAGNREQANSCRAGVERGCGEGASCQGHAKDARNEFGPPDKNA